MANLKDFKKFIHEATMAYQKDPIGTHPPGFDMSFDSDSDELKDEWIKSVVDKAKTFEKYLNSLFRHAGNEDHEYLSIDQRFILPDRLDEEHEITYHITNLIESIKKIHNIFNTSNIHHTNFERKAQNFPVSTGKMKDNIEEMSRYLIPKVGSRLNHIVEWIETIMPLIRSNKSVVIDHMFKKNRHYFENYFDDLEEQQKILNKEFVIFRNTKEPINHTRSTLVLDKEYIINKINSINNITSRILLFKNKDLSEEKNLAELERESKFSAELIHQIRMHISQMTDMDVKNIIKIIDDIAATISNIAKGIIGDRIYHNPIS